jgi:hypothetical protein
MPAVWEACVVSWTDLLLRRLTMVHPCNHLPYDTQGSLPTNKNDALIDQSLFFALFYLYLINLTITANLNC